MMKEGEDASPMLRDMNLSQEDSKLHEISERSDEKSTINQISLINKSVSSTERLKKQKSKVEKDEFK